MNTMGKFVKAVEDLGFKIEDEDGKKVFAYYQADGTRRVARSSWESVDKESVPAETMDPNAAVDYLAEVVLNILVAAKAQFEAGL